MHAPQCFQQTFDEGRRRELAHGSLSALVSGYKVFCIVDASGNWSTMSTDLTVARLAQAGAIPICMNGVLGEIMGTWNRRDAMDFASILVEHVTPAYRTLSESYDKAQNVQKVGRETKLERLEVAGV